MAIKRRDYLSWSQLNIWEKNPNLYYEIYVLGLEAPYTKWMKKGKDLAEYLKNGGEADNDVKSIAKLIPTYPEKEFEIKAKLNKNINLLGYLDSFDPKELKIYEYKTGKKYTQKMADKLGQLDFYTLLVWLKYQKLPKSIKLIWIETINKDDIVAFSGKIKTFEVKKTMKDIIKIVSRIHKAVKGIQEMWAAIDS